MTFGKNNQNIPVADIMSSYQRLKLFQRSTGARLYKNKNYKMAVLSNGDSEMLMVSSKTWPQDKFDTSLSAGSVKSFKIDFVYKLASDFFCKPEECLLVSANYWDIIGQAGMGLKLLGK